MIMNPKILAHIAGEQSAEKPSCECGGCTCGRGEMKPIFHKHLLINAKVIDPIRNEDDAIEFLRSLVSRIGMKIIKGPFASYVDVPGNRGLTAIVMIETSHIAFHIWDEKDPAVLQFDLYTCGTLDKDEVLAVLGERFNIHSMDYVLFDREDGFVILDQSAKRAEWVQEELPFNE